jgi:hypothetical protein
MLSSKEVSETDADQGKGDQELKYATPAIAPFSQSGDQALTWF